jgi:hypothetical protein
MFGSGRSHHWQAIFLQRFNFLICNNTYFLRGLSKNNRSAVTQGHNLEESVSKSTFHSIPPSVSSVVCLLSSRRLCSCLINLPGTECTIQATGRNLHSFIHPLTYSCMPQISINSHVYPYFDLSVLDFFSEWTGRDVCRMLLNNFH